MSKSPDWATKAKLNTIGKSLGEVSHLETVVVQPSKKPGRKKSRVERKTQALLNFSEYQNDKLDTLVLKLKLAGVKVKRGRSETVELALALVETMLKTDEAKTLSIINDFVDYEEKNLENHGDKD